MAGSGLDGELNGERCLETDRSPDRLARDYAKRQRVYRRCEDARDKVLRHLRSLNESQPFHDQVTAWLFRTGVTTHVLLVAGRQNPTVRPRYEAVQDLLADYGRLDFYETLLGCAQMSRA